jgi:hypothetical protein
LLGLQFFVQHLPDKMEIPGIVVIEMFLLLAIAGKIRNVGTHTIES